MPNLPRTVLLGCGGHARSVIEAALLSRSMTIDCALDADTSLWNTLIDGIKVAGGDDLLGSLGKNGVTHFIVSIGAPSDRSLRMRLFSSATDAGLMPMTVCHPSAVLATSAGCGDGTFIGPGAIVGAGATVGSNGIVNSGAIVEHDCTVGAHCHVATGALLTGGVRVGINSLVGAGATVLPGVVIGDHATVGAGATVVRDVEDGEIVAGTPARPLDR